MGEFRKNPGECLADIRCPVKFIININLEVFILGEESLFV